MLSRVKQFFEKDIWQVKPKTLPRLKSIGIVYARVLILSIRGFLADKCQIRASALTFFTLISMVPVLAMSFGFAKGFGLEKFLEKQILTKLSAYPEIAEKLIEFSKNALQNTQGGLIVGIGMIVLFWSVIKVLNNIETSFNEIWGLKTQRQFIQKVKNYLLILVFCPLFFIAAQALNIYIKTIIVNIANNVEFFSNISAPMFFLLKFLPFILLWTAFIFAYLFIPNTKVRLIPAVMGGIIGGTIFQLLQKLYLYFQVGVANYSTIYGSLASLPLFLVLIQMSWLVVLYGGEISFALQNHERYEFEIEPDEISSKLKELLALRITLACIENFCNELKPWSIKELCDELFIPVKLTQSLVFQLCECNILSRICNGDERYQPAKDVSLLSISSVLESFRSFNKKEMAIPEDKKTSHLLRSLEEFSQIIDKSNSNIILKSLVSK
ncbi:MAG: YihY/virulence factor BrkB family protein [Candidatus Aureabacteria bacterium]|nr:YihY/virulence factor BrkB family protein [Candidatus Auribacterota bacterium]